jgi:hypothetical protein
VKLKRADLCFYFTYYSAREHPPIPATLAKHGDRFRLSLPLAGCQHNPWAGKFLTRQPPGKGFSRQLQN